MIIDLINISFVCSELWEVLCLKSVILGTRIISLVNYEYVHLKLNESIFASGVMLFK